VIDTRDTFVDEAEAGIEGWVCEHCGGTKFEAVVMIDAEPIEPANDPYE
jgi:hypothetical protein